MPPHPDRWSDEKLAEFHDEFIKHVSDEKRERDQQAEIHEALFRKEDKESGVSPGVVQLLARVDDRLRTIEIATDRQKRFVGGVMFAFSCVGFLLTDSAHKLIGWLKGV